MQGGSGAELAGRIWLLPWVLKQFSIKAGSSQGVRPDVFLKQAA